MIGLFVVGALFVLAGGLAYTGRWRSWTAAYAFRPYIVFGALYLGLGAWCTGAALGLHGVAGGVFQFVGACCGVLLIMSVFWLPDVLLPAWFRQWRAAGSHHDVYARPLSRGRRG